MLLRDRQGVHRRNPHCLAALLDREAFSESPSDGEFVIHYRKHSAQKEQRADLGSLDIGSQGRRRLWEHQAEFAQPRTRFCDGGTITDRHGPLHPLGCFRPLRTWRSGDRAPRRRCQKFHPSAEAAGVNSATRSISGPISPFDWNRFRSLFLPTARIGEAGTEPSGKPHITFQSVNDWIRSELAAKRISGTKPSTNCGSSSLAA